MKKIIWCFAKKLRLILLLFMYGIVFSCSDEYEILLNEKTIAKRVTRSTSEYDYPDVEQILGDATVMQGMNSAWQSCITKAADSIRCEYGFNVFYSTSGDYYISKITHGGEVRGVCKDEVGFTPPPCSSSVEQHDLCAIFHTHTSLWFFPKNCRRRTGPSRKDSLVENQRGIPVITRDYTSAYIYGGDPVNSSYMDYRISLNKHR